MCLFCDIAAHEHEAFIVDETERTVTFLDIAPANEGHVLIIPKLHVDSIVDMPDEYVLEMTAVARRMVKAFAKVYGAAGYGIMQNGGANCEFGHFHLHVFPRLEGDGYDWIYPEGPKEVSQAVADRLRGALKQ
ncbi:Diadenosine tetraphosphate (Ap4A) hydrolase [Ruminococcaceae bacterium YRB3002]|nr:Diadenosine tetraphosphate (Ap4A) hydrolase [Ruminococcaceae bacterium YRB3002]